MNVKIDILLIMVYWW